MSVSKDYSLRYLELDVLRGFAAISVLCFHFTKAYRVIYGLPRQSMLFNFEPGKFGVHLFFMISGFVILMTLERTTHIFDFIVSRFSRLYPVYWGAIFLTFIIMKFFSSVPTEVPLKTALIDLSMMQYWFHVDDLSPLYWTLAVELLFYSLMAVVFLAKALRYIELFGILWLVVMLLNKFFVFGWGPLIFLKFVFSGLLRYGNLFVTGILFYGLKIKGNKWYRHVGLGLCFVVQCIMWIDVDKEAVTCFMFFLFLFYLFVMNRLYFIRQKPLVYFGTISYSLYLIHQNIGFIIIQWLFLLGFNPLLRFVVPTVCCILIATLMTYYIEKPAMKYIRQSYKDWKKDKV